MKMSSATVWNGYMTNMTTSDQCLRPDGRQFQTRSPAALKYACYIEFSLTVNVWGENDIETLTVADTLSGLRTWKCTGGSKAQIPAPTVIRKPIVSPFRQRNYSVVVERRGSGSPVRKLLRRLGWYSFTQFAVAANAWRHGASCCCCWRWWRWCVVMRRERWLGRAVMDSCRLHFKECPTCRLSGIGNCDFTMTCKLPVHTTIHVCRGMQCVYANLLPE